MRIKFKAGVVVAAASALAIAVPAAAHPNGSDHPSSSNHPNHSSGSHKCMAHNVAYIVHGTIDSSQLPITVTNGVASSGMLEVQVTRTNHWAKNDKTAMQPVGYQLGPNTKVKFDTATPGFSAGERVTLIGKAPVISKHCPGGGTVGTPTFRMVVVHPPAS